MTRAEQIDEEHEKLNGWINILQKNPNMIGYQSGNDSLMMQIIDGRFYTGYEIDHLSKALTVTEFINSRQYDIVQGNLYTYWFDRKLTIEEIVDNM